MRHRHAVADEQDDVLGKAPLGRAERRPIRRAAWPSPSVASTTYLPPVVESRAADPVGGVPETVLVGGDVRRSSEHLGRILAVDRHLEIGSGWRAGKLDLQVEVRAGEYLRFVEGIDRLAGGGGAKGASTRAARKIDSMRLAYPQLGQAAWLASSA